VWQSLQLETKDQNFTVLAVALDVPEAARPWIESASASYPCLIDRDHVVAELYNLVNVPQAVWIDETGTIVRPAETAGSNDGFRAMDRQTLVVPDDVLAERKRLKAAYFDAVRDWAMRGAESPHALDAEGVRARLRVPDAAVAQAHVRFRLGRLLARASRDAEATAQFAEATRLHPESWAMWRQTAAKNERGLASGPEFWKRVDALGNRPYYAPVEIDAASPPPKGGR